MNRREFLKGTASAFACVAVTPAGAVIPEIKAARALMPVFCVGTPGDSDAIFIPAVDEDEAIAGWLGEMGYGDRCMAEEIDEPRYDMDRDDYCEYCFARNGLEAGEIPKFAGREKFFNADWLRVGMSGPCDRCGEQASPYEGAIILAGDAVCYDCLLRESAS